MALVTRHEYDVYALVLNAGQKELLKNAFCSRVATHCINVKLRELNQEEGDKFNRKWFTTQKPHFAVTQVGVIVEKDKIGALSGVQFFDNRKLALEKLSKKVPKSPMAEIITVMLLINVPKLEQRKSA